MGPPHGCRAARRPARIPQGPRPHAPRESHPGGGAGPPGRAKTGHNEGATTAGPPTARQAGPPPRGRRSAEGARGRDPRPPDAPTAPQSPQEPPEAHRRATTGAGGGPAPGRAPQGQERRTKPPGPHKARSGHRDGRAARTGANAHGRFGIMGGRSTPGPHTADRRRSAAQEATGAGAGADHRERPPTAPGPRRGRAHARQRRRHQPVDEGTQQPTPHAAIMGQVAAGPLCC